MNKLFFALCISIFYAVGFGQLWFGIKSAKESAQASSWPSVQGTITNVSLREDSDSDGDTTYEVEVQYNYSVMGQNYTSSRLAFGYAASSVRQRHKDILDKLERASSVNVRYDPRDPSTSTLSFGIHSSIKLTLLFNIVWLLFAFLAALMLWVSISTINFLIFMFIVVITTICSFILAERVSTQPDNILLKNIQINSTR